MERDFKDIYGFPLSNLTGETDGNRDGRYHYRDDRTGQMYVYNSFTKTWGTYGCRGSLIKPPLTNTS